MAGKKPRKKKKKPEKEKKKEEKKEKKKELTLEEQLELEKKVEKEKEEIEKRLEKAEKELSVIEKKDLEVVGIERIKEEISKIRNGIDYIAGAKTKEKQTIYGLLAIIAFLVILATPLPGLSDIGQKTLAIFVFVLVLWITEIIPLPATALIPGVLLYFFGIRPTPTDAFKTYAHPAVFFVIGSLLIAHALVQSGLAKRFAILFLSKCRGSPNLLLLIFVAAPALLSAFISDHLMAALLIPVAVTIVVVTKMEGPFKTALVLAVALGAGIGGLATPSAGAKNVIALGLLEEIAGLQIGYGEWMLAAFPITLILIPVVWLVLRTLFPPGSVDIKVAVKELTKNVRPMGPRQWKVLAIFALTILLFIFTSNLIGLGTVAIIGAVLMFLVGGMKWEEAEKGITWGVMFIYGAAITMGIALKDTGAAEWLARLILGVLPSSHPFLIMFGIVSLAILLTNIMSDGAAASVLAPITITLAIIAGLDARMIALATAIPVSLSFLTIFGTPGNVMAHSTGYVSSKDLAKAGFIIVGVAIVVLYIVAKYYWSYLGLY